jgi:tetratricopeptide (TPR) repeat protein
LYLLIFAGLLAVMGLLAAMLPYNPGITLIILGTLFAIPGRVLGIVFREHFRGRRQHDARNFEAALHHFSTFLSQTREQPWRRRFMWMSWGFYTWNIEAMTLNNIGSCLMNLGRFDEAEEKLQEAISTDAEYAMPYWNHAILAFLRGDEVAAESYVQRAAHLGYRHSTSDHLVQAVQMLSAKIEGWGGSQTHQKTEQP